VQRPPYDAYVPYVSQRHTVGGWHWWLAVHGRPIGNRLGVGARVGASVGDDVGAGELAGGAHAARDTVGSGVASAPSGARSSGRHIPNPPPTVTGRAVASRTHASRPGASASHGKKEPQ